MSAAGSRARSEEFVSAAEWAARGRAARRDAPRSSHAAWRPAADRPDPVALLEEQAREPRPRARPDPPRPHAGLALHLLPRRRLHHGGRPRRRRPASGFEVQLCGDAHLLNFGVFASPERQMLFDINDFDETLPGPVGVGREAPRGELRDRRPRPRLLARRPPRHRHGRRRASTATPCAGPAKMRALDVWYAQPHGRRHHGLDPTPRCAPDGSARRRPGRPAPTSPRRARACTSARSRRLAGEVDGKLRIVADPPLVVPLDDLVRAGHGPRGDGGVDARAHPALPPHAHAGGTTRWSSTATSTRRARWSASAASARAPGSSSSRAASDQAPLFLQAKEAQASVLERFLGRSALRATTAGASSRASA